MTSTRAGALLGVAVAVATAACGGLTRSEARRLLEGDKFFMAPATVGVERAYPMRDLSLDPGGVVAAKTDSYSHVAATLNAMRKLGLATFEVAEREVRQLGIKRRQSVLVVILRKKGRERALEGSPTGWRFPVATKKDIQVADVADAPASIVGKGAKVRWISWAWELNDLGNAFDDPREIQTPKDIHYLTSGDFNVTAVRVVFREYHDGWRVVAELSTP